ncbi:MAG TPA: hypothetical protein VLH09_03695, partial [Bryobacteraceae bacterium]|nr:hypothetical protein [Bryobacteraceae bacterium]
EEAFTVPPAGSAPAGAGDRELIAAAVERYLSERGIRFDAPRVPEQVVDQFLASKRKPTVAVSSAVQPAAAPPAAAPSAPPPPEVKIADFVCESDVREAVQAGRKIYIGPRTIVTPSARELGDHHDILVVAERR